MAEVGLIITTLNTRCRNVFHQKVWLGLRVSLYVKSNYITDMMIELSDFKGGSQQRKKDGIRIDIEDEDDLNETDYDGGGKPSGKPRYAAFNETR